MKKFLSVLLAALMIVAMIPTVFAASTPVITAKADKTTIKAGDTVTITVSVSKNSKLCALTYALKYDTAEFEVVKNSGAVQSVFGTEVVNTAVSGSIKYVAASSTNISDSAQTLFTVKLKAKKTTGKITCVIDEAYTASGISETNVTSAVSAASTKSISFRASTNYVDIKTPSRTSIRYKDGIVLHANIVKTLPSGAKIKWTKDNNNFTMEPSADGKTCTIISNSDGKTTFTVTVTNSSGVVLDEEAIVMTSKAGFFDILGGFFRSLFGSTKIYAE